ncbi:hypothetical protein BZA70DRAFT_280755 [Myxozyma melibiosi]|uniref:Uncharacterized protein n=1 Tax=Myxozyma melibiosi TaxID=54550 RepID=A0ABR1F3K6_9ASCO
MPKKKADPFFVFCFAVAITKIDTNTMIVRNQDKNSKHPASVNRILVDLTLQAPYITILFSPFCFFGYPRPTKRTQSLVITHTNTYAPHHNAINRPPSLRLRHMHYHFVARLRPLAFIFHNKNLVVSR